MKLIEKILLEIHIFECFISTFQRTARDLVWGLVLIQASIPNYKETNIAVNLWKKSFIQIKKYNTIKLLDNDNGTKYFN